MTEPQMKPCPNCGKTGGLAVYKYDNGWRYVECDGRGCWYRGPGEGSIIAAIKSHNKHANALTEPCPYCSNGARTGLPGNACENCMNTGLKYPEHALNSQQTP